MDGYGIRPGLLSSVLKRDGEAAVADWVSARDLRRRLEQLSAAQRKRLPGPTVSNRNP
jgi:hypothetical protein